MKQFPRLLSLILSLCLLAGCAGPAIPREFEVRLAGTSRGADRNRALFAALESPISVDLADTPLRDALAAIAGKAGLPLVVDWNALNNADLRPDSHVTMQLLNAPAREAFNSLFRSITAPDVEENSAIWMATDGVVVVGTIESMVPRRKTIHYPVADILEHMDIELFEDDTLDQHPRAAAAMFHFADQPPAPDGDDDAGDEWEAARETLFALIEDASSVRPELWDSGDGHLCVMNEHAGVLVLTAPEEVHRRTFRALRAVRYVIDQARR